MVTMDFTPQLIPFNHSDRITRPGSKGQYGMPVLKTVNNYTIKSEMKQKKNGQLINVLVPELFNSCSAWRKHSQLRLCKLVIMKFIKLS